MSQRLADIKLWKYTLEDRLEQALTESDPAACTTRIVSLIHVQNCQWVQVDRGGWNSARLEQTEHSVNRRFKLRATSAQSKKLLVRSVGAMTEGIHMYLMSRLLNPRNLAMLAAAALPLLSSHALAQTWVGNRAGPALVEILTIDATGEPNWLWGAEDVAGNGANNFPIAEQAIDARTVYVATDATRFYSRVYFSIPQAEPGDVTTFVLIDADQNTATGGRASSTDLDPNFSTDPTIGGYDYAIKVARSGNGAMLSTLWRFDNVTQVFTEFATQPDQVLTESNFFVDPLRVNEIIHGYVQSSVELGLVGLTQACNARIFVRTTNQTANLGVGDLDVGSAENCVPTLNPDNNVPVVVIPPVGCTSDAECPNGGVCVNGNCQFARPCIVNADCPPTDACNDGRCVVVGGNACVDSSTCNGLVCQGGRCVVCANNGACGPGFVCGPDGRCVAGNTPITCIDSSTCNGLICPQGQCVPCTSDATCGTGFVCGTDGRCLASNGNTTVPSDAGQIYLAPGERLQGGACACRNALGRSEGILGLVSLLGLVVLLGRNVKREHER